MGSRCICIISSYTWLISQRCITAACGCLIFVAPVLILVSLESWSHKRTVLLFCRYLLCTRRRLWVTLWYIRLEFKSQVDLVVWGCTNCKQRLLHCCCHICVSAEWFDIARKDFSQGYFLQKRQLFWFRGHGHGDSIWNTIVWPRSRKDVVKWSWAWIVLCCLPPYNISSFVFLYLCFISAWNNFVGACLSVIKLRAPPINLSWWGAI